MIDYLEKILAMMAGWEDEESGWPERKLASPGEKNSALDEALAVPEAGRAVPCRAGPGGGVPLGTGTLAEGVPDPGPGHRTACGPGLPAGRPPL